MKRILLSLIIILGCSIFADAQVLSYRAKSLTLTRFKNGNIDATWEDKNINYLIVLDGNKRITTIYEDKNTLIYDVVSASSKPNDAIGNSVVEQICLGRDGVVCVIMLTFPQIDSKRPHDLLKPYSLRIIYDDLVMHYEMYPLY